ncbi:MAG TPA: ATP-binding protein [Anaerolineae bacterium]|nr:ATP-binding protein [Anaerolineae bacterium]
MNIKVPSDFSVYQLAETYHNDEMFYDYRGVLRNISAQIEAAVIENSLKTRVFAGFQKMSFFLPMVNRYKKLAQTAETVWVFGVPDVTPPEIDNVKYVYLDEADKLTSEWFLVVDTPTYFSALSAFDLTGFDVPHKLRQFKGVWTFEADLTHRLQEALSKVVGEEPLAVGSRDLETHLHQISMTTIRLINALEARNIKLRASQQLREDLSHMLVHDMRNPLTGILSLLQLLTNEGISKQLSAEKRLRMINNAIQNGYTLNRMIEDMLDVAKMEDVQMQLELKPVQVAPLVANALLPIAPQVEREEKELIVDNRSMPAIQGDKDKLERVLHNLLSNALKYTNHEIRVEMEVVADKLKIAVVDDGPGIPLEAQKRIFSKFEQVGGSNQKRGTGLGLTFCRLVVDAHGGQIYVESDGQKGSAFVVELPLAQ